MACVRGSRHHTIIVVDVEKFGDRRRTLAHQVGVRDGLYRVVRDAFDAAGVPWADCYREDRGDGMFILVPASESKAVFIDTLPYLLVKALRVHNETHVEAQRIRLRMAMHAGEVHHDDHGVTSAALILAFRLLDAEPLKAALATSPGVLAMITSDWFFEDVVRHCPGAAPTTYHPVSIAQKETTTSAWIALPDHPYYPRAERVAQQPWLVPRQLPLAVHDFTGRADHLATLDALTPADSLDQGGKAQAVVISAIDGTAGIGKTTLAVQWAHQVQHRFPDGTLHVNLRGYGPGDPATPSEVLDGFLRALDTPAEKMPTGVEAQAALYRSLMNGRRMLIVLDNANSADQVRPLLPGSAGCTVLVTSRDSLNGLVVTEAAHRLTLDLLTEPEALELVTGIIGIDRVATEPDAVTELVSLCARLPLALRIAASKVAAHPHATVDEVVTELADRHNRLNLLSGDGDEHSAVRKVFDWSYQRLPAEQARLFRCLGLHPGPDLSLAAAAAAAELDTRATRLLLDGLMRGHLVEPASHSRYRVHDLLRAYAADLAHQHEGMEACERISRALLDWYTNTARACDALVFPANPRVPVRSTDVHTTLSFDRTQAMQWLEIERTNLLAVLDHAVRCELHKQALWIADSMRFLHLVGSWDENLEVDTIGITVARLLDDGGAESYFLARRSDAYIVLSRWEEAQSDLDQALTLARALDDRLRHAWAFNGLANLAIKREQFEDALTCLHEALPLSRGIDTGRLEAVVEGNFARAFVGLGRYRQALEHGQRGLAFRRSAGDLHGEPFALYILASAWLGVGEHETVMSLCRQAIDIGREVGNPVDTVARPLATLAVSLHHTGRTAEAAACWHEAADLFDYYGRPDSADQARQSAHSATTEAVGDNVDQPGTRWV
jgi:tetratricopeptide (TPR) repeat protein